MGTRKFGLKILLAMLFATLIISACTPPKQQPAPEQKAPSAKAPSAPAYKPLGDPFKFIFYKNDSPYAGKEIWSLSLGVGEEIPVSIQALDTNRRDTGACPVNWTTDKTIVAVTPIPGKCNAVKIKGLKAANNASLIAVFKGAKGNLIEAPLNGSVGKSAAQPKSAQPQTDKPKENTGKSK